MHFLFFECYIDGKKLQKRNFRCKKYEKSLSWKFSSLQIQQYGWTILITILLRCLMAQPMKLKGKTHFKDLTA